jgi:hypothetical protein
LGRVITQQDAKSKNENKNYCVDSALGSLHRVDMSSVAHVSEVYATAIFRIEL